MEDKLGRFLNDLVIVYSDGFEYYLEGFVFYVFRFSDFLGSIFFGRIFLIIGLWGYEYKGDKIFDFGWVYVGGFR